MIPHIPSEQVKMRIGLHSGPVAAGVVGEWAANHGGQSSEVLMQTIAGMTMPRFCLFGKTPSHTFHPSVCVCVCPSIACFDSRGHNELGQQDGEQWRG
jgi:hypothetical protein